MIYNYAASTRPQKSTLKIAVDVIQNNSKKQKNMNTSLDSLQRKIIALISN